MSGSHLGESGPYLEGQLWGYEWRDPADIPAEYQESEGDLYSSRK